MDSRVRRSQNEEPLPVRSQSLISLSPGKSEERRNEGRKLGELKGTIKKDRRREGKKANRTRGEEEKRGPLRVRREGRAAAGPVQPVPVEKQE